MSVINKDQNYAIADVNTLEINVVSWLKPSNGRLDFMLLAFTIKSGTEVGFEQK